MKTSLLILVIVVLLTALWLHTSDARRGGGGGRGGSRGSRARSGSSRSSSRVRYYKGPTYRKGSWKTAAAAGTVFGLMAYKRRRMYYSHPNREPSICYNEKNLRNGTLGYFVCPEQRQLDELRYCCGPSDEQKCCKTKPMSGGAVAGIVIGVIVVCLIVGCGVYCYCKRRKTGKGGVVIKDNKPKAEHMPLNAAQNQPVPMQTMPAYTDQSAPQAYDPNAPGLPYSTNPGGVDGVTPYPPAAQPYGQPPPIGFTDDKPPMGYEKQPYPASYPGGYPPTAPAPGPMVAPPPYPATQ